MLELLGMKSSPSLLSLPGPPGPGVVAPDRVLCVGQIEQISELMQSWIFWNSTVFEC